MEPNVDIYREIALSQIPRILGLGDRSSNSRTFGCFDRNFWRYKLIDFPNARFQEVSLLLALLYNNNFDQNIYFNKSNAANWSMAAISFWINSLNKDGSVNEIYPYERSFCATSFSAYAVTESCLLTGRNDLSGKITKTGDWLASHNNMDVANQAAASILSLYNIYLLTGLDRYKEAAENRMGQLLDRQHKEGYFIEYDGFDVGYLTITLSLLAKYYKKVRQERLKSSLIKADSFLKKNISQEGFYNSKIGSRKTQFIYPFGLAVIGSEIINSHIKGLAGNRIINPLWLDDRYVIQLTIDFLETYLELKNAHDKL